MFSFQEKFAEHKVLDAILALLSLMNAIQLEKLTQHMNANTTGHMQQTVELESEADQGLHLTEVMAASSENVSTMAEAG